MSYNIVNSDILNLGNLKIPLRKLFDYPDLEYVFCKDDQGCICIDIEGPVEGFCIFGILEDDYTIRFSGMSYFGSWSGNWLETFENLLSNTTGRLIMRLTWEEGDNFLLEVNDGVVERRESD